MLYWSCHCSIGHIRSTRNVPKLGAGIPIGAEIEARHLSNVGVELLYLMYKLTYIDALGHLKYICDVVLILLCHVDEKHGEQVEVHAIVEQLARHSPWAFQRDAL